MVDKVQPDPARPGIVQVPVQSQRVELPLEFPREEGGGDAAAGVAAFVRAEEDDVIVGAGVGGEGVLRGDLGRDVGGGVGGGRRLGEGE